MLILILLFFLIFSFPSVTPIIYIWTFFLSTISQQLLDEILKGALAWYGKLTWESAHAWILKILCYLIVWGITLIFMVRLSFHAIPLLIYDVMNDITIIP